jgi:hypothetical protein
MQLRKLSTVCLLQFVVLHLLSQSNFSCGIKAGVNGDLAKVFKPGYSLKETNNHLGGELLFSVNQSVSKVFSLQGESGFRYKHYYLNLTSSPRYSSTHIQGQFGFLSYDFLILPQLETQKKVRFLFNTGAIFGCVLLAHGNGYREQISSTGPTGSSTKETTNYSGVIKSKIERFSIAYVASAGVKVLSAKNYYYTLEARYVLDPINHLPIQYYYIHHLLSLHLAIHFNMPARKQK